MTDSSAPLPRPRSDLTEPPDAASAKLQPDGMDLLQSRMLIQVSAARLGYVQDQVDPGRSGLVLCGTDAVQKAGTLRFRKGYTAPLLIDPAVYEVSAATEENPFPYDVEPTLFLDDPLELSLAEQRDAGATLPMTPTGYIRAEDSDALRAAVMRTLELDDPSVIFSAPVDVSWLRDEESTRQLIAYLKMLKGPKAIMLGGQMDPLGRYAKAVNHLRLLVNEVPQSALLRTDLAAFGALAAGASFTAFGASSRYRHIVAPGEKAQTNKRVPVRSPHVLFPELMAFFLGETIAKRYGGADVPICFCAACEGSMALDAFTSNRGELPAAAAAHNVAVLMEWLRTLTAVEPGIARQQWWFDRCRNAVDQYTVINTSIRQPGAFKSPAQLDRWAHAAPAAVEAHSSDSRR
ncbi:hypothetical protein OG895_15815 [Streptomyces sp. NBC_00201]|uniref:hypothetical protein n=1 Tax=Streptomyces sp. NBC_00201 TaxID=2975679 RepID=UPI002254EA75|nr:hypothetical protein [Streptomyces sp. NBC_00201]MCX5246684.1 hypothetical protein [Streptomyces sp. NBC_00201]